MRQDIETILSESLNIFVYLIGIACLLTAGFIMVAAPITLGTDGLGVILWFFIIAAEVLLLAAVGYLVKMISDSIRDIRMSRRPEPERVRVKHR